jgi:hypothetical protein
VVLFWLRAREGERGRFALALDFILGEELDPGGRPCRAWEMIMDTQKEQLFSVENGGLIYAYSC